MIQTHPKLEQILQEAMSKGASDIHLKAGVMPVIRRFGKLRPLGSQWPSLKSAEIEEMIMMLLDEGQREQFEKNKDLDLGYGISGLGRFRFNIFKQRGSLRVVIRSIPYTVPTLQELHLPKILQKISNYERGLVLVTGITGSGKSSTLAGIVDAINKTKNKHILTIEDPIEFLIRDKKSIITQRELGADATSFSRALRAALRQDPDVILIGEMRDRETIETALVAAETGHLVLSTLHTMDSKESINRIISVFEPHHQQQVRYQLASVLKAIVSQRLIRRKDNKGFIPAVEVLINNTRIQDMIVKPERTGQIHSAIEESRTSYGMQSFDQSLADLVSMELIEFEEALKQATNPEDFSIQFTGISKDGKQWRKTPQDNKNKDNQWDEVSDIEVEDLSKPKKGTESN